MTEEEEKMELLELVRLFPNWKSSHGPSLLPSPPPVGGRGEGQHPGGEGGGSGGKRRGGQGRAQAPAACG